VVEGLPVLQLGSVACSCAAQEWIKADGPRRLLLQTRLRRTTESYVWSQAILSTMPSQGEVWFSDFLTPWRGPHFTRPIEEKRHTWTTLHSNKAWRQHTHARPQTRSSAWEDASRHHADPGAPAVSQEVRLETQHLRDQSLRQETQMAAVLTQLTKLDQIGTLVASVEAMRSTVDRTRPACCASA
jgi:hypothetical protein